MKKFFKVLGVVGIAAAAAVVTSSVLSDQETLNKVNDALDKAKKAANAVVKTVREGIEQAQRQAGMNADEKNQAWADEQWEAIGI